MTRMYPSGQAASAEYAFHTWLMSYMTGFGEVNPVLAAAGLMETSSTPTRKYHVPIPPLGISDIVDGDEAEDGKEWPAKGIQSSEIEGACRPRGIAGLEMTEDDLLETKVPVVSANMTALGRQEKLFEDKMGARALELGVTTTTASDGKLIFAVDHYIDPVAKTGKQSNSYKGGISPDKILEIIAGFRALKTEGGDPVYPEEAQFSLVVPPALQPDAERSLDREYVAEAVGAAAAASVKNVSYKRAGLVILPQLVDPQRWFVAATNLPRKAIARILFRALMRFQLGPESDLWKSKRKMKVYANEKSDYRLVDWRLIATSK